LIILFDIDAGLLGYKDVATEKIHQIFLPLSWSVPGGRMLVHLEKGRKVDCRVSHRCTENQSSTEWMIRADVRVKN
jgi:hypothetical protein